MPVKGVALIGNSNGWVGELGRALLHTNVIDEAVREVRSERSWRWFGQGRLRSMQRGNRELARMIAVTRRIKWGITGVARIV